MRVLAVVAHPDDEVIGCGASLAKLTRAGHEVRVLLPLIRCDPRGRETWQALLSAFGESCRRLGATPVLLDPLLEETAAETHVHQLHDALLPSVQWADTVLTHWHGDANQVHRGVARAVEIATRPFRRRKNVYLFEVATSTEQAFSPSFAPNLYVVLDPADAAAKRDAMALYPAEAAPGRRPADLQRRMEQRGVEAGAELAEAFVVARLFLE